MKCGIVLIGLVGCTSAYSEDLCQVREVSEIKQEECHTRVVPYRNGSEIITTQVATVVTARRVEIDLAVQDVAYAVRTPTGQIQQLTVFPYFGDAHPLIEAKLGFQQFSVDRRVVYESKFVELIEGQYCATYVGKFPFVGEYSDCGGWAARNSLRYAEGVISATDARKRICAIVEEETADICGGGSGGVYANKLVSDERGELGYRLMARVRLRAHPKLQEKAVRSEYDERIYKVRLNGEVSLIESSQNP